ncbi:MAG: TlpA family protein disulfide reductase [Bdellovibrio sp.]|nr:TlpA family protein disulfide reductase [Bdellovibrio sp.]
MKLINRAKILPLLFFILTFTGVLVGQIIFNNFKLVAGPTTLESNRAAQLEHVFKTLNLVDYNGVVYEASKMPAKIIVINFWAAWCMPCLEEMPGLVDLHKQFNKNEVMIFGVNEDTEDQQKNIEKISSKFSIQFPLIPDKDSILANRLFISTIPQTLIFKNGKIIDVIQGQKDFTAKEFSESIRLALKP